MSFIDYPYYLFLFLLLFFVLFTRVDRRWFLLLAFSIFFYGYGRWEYLLLLLFSISIDYLCALKIGVSKILRNRRFWLLVSITSNLGILLFFKYFITLYDDWTWIEVRTSPLKTQVKNIVLPLGISFYTLQSMGYTIDIYRNKIQPERHFGLFSLYVCFFPQLVAGPIERPKNLLPQLHKPAPITLQNIESGLFLIGMGLFKKLIISDRLFILIQDFIREPNKLAGWQALVFGTLAVSAIYIDIAAYTSIARGSARIFGIELSRNFNRPFLALSAKEFWQRWHISVTAWIMDYVYRPIAQFSRSKIHRSFALIATFLIIGLWHGPTVPYLLMGALQGIFIVLENIAASNGLRWPDSKVFNALRLFRSHILINISGVLFLSPTMEIANSIYANIFNFESFWGKTSLVQQLHGYYFIFLLTAGLVTIFLTHVIRENHTLRASVSITPAWFRIISLYFLFFVIFAFSTRSSDEFLYFIF